MISIPRTKSWHHRLGVVLFLASALAATGCGWRHHHHRLAVYGANASVPPPNK